jgi:hypothetical protein
VKVLCRICCGDAPDPYGFRDFEVKAKRAIRGVNSLSQFLDEAKFLDKLRFDSGEEWGEPQIFHTVRRLIFANPDPDEGLLMFTLGCWLDMQAQYVTVWTTYLRQAKLWLDGEGSMPRGGFSPTKTHMSHTRRAVKKYGSISQWFIQKINDIATKHPKGEGNMYRLAGELCTDLYNKPQVVGSLRLGSIPNSFSGGDHKRFWMFMMCLRRDNSIVKCLFQRALGKFEGGEEAAKKWYDPQCYNPIECELPVDSWVLSNWNTLFNRIELPELLTPSRSEVARKARKLARKNGISPSTFDAILFYSGSQ